MRFAKTTMMIGALVAFSGAVLADPIYHIGNTLIIKRTTGTGQLFYQADHTFTLFAIGGEVIKGKWTSKDGKLCHVEMDSKSLQDFCVPEDHNHRVGDTWEVKLPNGIQETLTLVAGQEALKTPPKAK